MYPIEDSPLYKLRTKRKLAELLGIDMPELNRVTRDTERNYKVFSIRSGTKERWIQEPKRRLKQIHKRVFNLLQRIDAPDYLHSGIKGRSYMTNAAAHTGPHQVYKLDIKSFFPSVAPTHIYYFFNELLKCSPDVAWKVRAICTMGDKLPTGSCISQVAAFYAYRPLFDRLAELAESCELCMTCYVDDLTFSGRNVSGRFKFEAKQAISRAGLVAHKERFYGHTKKKLVTGVVIDGDKLLVRNKHRLSIYHLLKLLRGLPPGDERDQLLRSLVGRCCAASIIEPEFKSIADSARRQAREAAQLARTA